MPDLTFNPALELGFDAPKDIFQELKILNKGRIYHE